VSAGPEQRRKRVAVPIGDPAGIGCEVALKALARPEIRAACDAVLVGDAWLVERCNRDFGTGLTLSIVDSPGELRFESDRLEILNVPTLDRERFRFGVVSAENGRALIKYVSAAVGLAQQAVVDCVIAAPQNETSVNRAGIKFDGYSNFVARLTRTPEEDVFLLLTSTKLRICHVTLHIAMRGAIEQIRRSRVLKAIQATAAALVRMGLPQPRIAVSGLNPHAGEHGLFGREEIDEIAPAVEDAKAAGLCIGTPILFGSVAHGSAHDIAGRGSADATSMMNALRWATGS
jgi:4-hydroxy-L-threonine phosphate dehydrogenase PdxA